VGDMEGKIATQVQAQVHRRVGSNSKESKRADQEKRNKKPLRLRGQ
jgi:hypothetical protein